MCYNSRVCSMSYKKINLKSLEYNPTNRYKVKTNPWNVVQKHNSISFLQQSWEVFNGVVSKLGQTCMSITPILHILEEIVQ